MLPQKGILLVISAPSGAGKGTVAKKLVESSENTVFSVSATTRQPRNGEIEGKDYFFLTKDEFQELKDKDALLEYAEYCGNCYGTPKEVVKKWLNEGKNVILEIDTKGGSQIKSKISDSVLVFILPPSLKELKSRLVGRNTESEDVINKRLTVAKEEIPKAMEYDYVVLNDDLDDCVNDIINIIKSEKSKSSRMKYLVEEVLNSEKA